MPCMRCLAVIVLATGVAAADPPADHDVGFLGGAGANVSATGGLLFELGLHVRDTVSLSGNGTMMGEWYHATIEARYFPTAGAWRPYLSGGIGALNNGDLFEDFISIGVGGEHRSASRHWGLYAQLSIDKPYSSRRMGMAVANESSPYVALGFRYYR